MPAHEQVRTALARHLSRHGFGTEAYATPGLPVRVGPITLRFPNPGVLPLHDLHHVATGFPADFVGEAEVSAYELRAGGAPPLVRFLCVGSVILALPVAPRRVWRAWRKSRGARSLYESGLDMASLLELEVGALRALLRLPVNGISGER